MENKSDPDCWPTWPRTAWMSHSPSFSFSFSFLLTLCLFGSKKPFCHSLEKPTNRRPQQKEGKWRGERGRERVCFSLDPYLFKLVPKPPRLLFLPLSLVRGPSIVNERASLSFSSLHFSSPVLSPRYIPCPSLLHVLSEKSIEQA